MATSEPEGETAQPTPATLVLGHTASGELVKVATAELAGVAVWGDHGNYLARLAGQLARQGVGVTYVGKAEYHALVVAAGGQWTTQTVGGLTTRQVAGWIRAQRVVPLALVGNGWLGELIQYHQQAARQLAADGQPTSRTLVLDCHPDLYLQAPLLGLLQSRCVLPLLSLRSATLCSQPLPDGVLRLVFRSGEGTELARVVLQGERSGAEVERLRAGWAYLAATGQVTAVNTAAVL